MWIGIPLLGSGALFLLGASILAIRPDMASQWHLYLVMGFALYAIAGLWLLQNLLHLRRILNSAPKPQRRSTGQYLLSDLPDRSALVPALDAALERWRKGGPAAAVLLVDLDRFKRLKETHGHATGDRVLEEVARRLVALSGPSMQVAHMGGDEFAVLTEDDTRLSQETICDRVLRAIRAPIEITGGTIRISATIGFAVCNAERTQTPSLLRAAELALGRAKREARGRMIEFEDGAEHVEDPHGHAWDFERALQRDEIVPFYQPLFALDDHRLIGFEVLARWQHPVRGEIGPAGFIPVAEELGRIGELFDRLLARACRDASAWPPDLRLSVNVSPTQFSEPQMASRILRILAESNFSPARLELEITENALVGDVPMARLILEELRELGVSVALDDFGTGYSSLLHLNALPVDRLKIDRGFVASARLKDEDWRMVRGILQLAGTFNLATTAEGIEEPETLTTLRDLGCDMGQGYLLGRPISAEQTSLWLNAQASRPLASRPLASAAG